ncbi:MAG: hypothetical protein HY744_28295 [Deltaproteobacteria bacterium]|nr:hypothetical protein [Deltaproteobacteria bacterium]
MPDTTIPHDRRPARPGQAHGAIILVDSSAEGAVVRTALRDAGFAVVDAPPELVAGQAQALAPLAVLVNLDQPEALQAARELVPDRPPGLPGVGMPTGEPALHVDEPVTGDAETGGVALSAPARPALIALGAAELGAEAGISRDRVFPHPVDVPALLELVRRLVVRSELARHRGGPASTGAGLTPSRESTPAGEIGTGPGSEPLLAGFPALAGLPEIEAMLPEVDAKAGAGAAARQLSPDIQRLLDRAKERIQEARPDLTPLPLAADATLLPPELGEGLDELLGLQDEPAAPTVGFDALASAVRAIGQAPARPAAASERPEPTASSGAGPPAPGHEGAPTAPPAPPSALDPAGPAASGPAQAAPRSEAPAPAGYHRSPASVGRVAPTDRPADSVAARVDTAAGETVRGRPGSLPPAQVAARGEPQLAGDPLVALARAIGARTTGVLAVRGAAGARRIVLRDGDIATAASELPDETLRHFLVERGDLSPELAGLHAGAIPAGGRHAAAALIAHGFLGQDSLWPVLRAHAEWIMGRAVLDSAGTVALDARPPESLLAEPNVFGGATGAEVLVETVRRFISPEDAIARLGGLGARLAAGRRDDLLAETALADRELAAIRSAAGLTVGQMLARHGREDHASLLLALTMLGVLGIESPAAPAPGDRAGEAAPAAFDPLDAKATRERVRARLALVHEGDYFSPLGLGADATAYEIRRAFVSLRRAFEPRRLLTAATADLQGDVELIVAVLEEAHEILRDPHRRERYREAILATAGAGR